MDIIGLIGNKEKARKAQQYQKAMTQLEEYANNLQTRTPKDRSKDKEQIDLLGDRDCDVKAHTMLIVSGVDKDIANCVKCAIDEAIMSAIEEVKTVGNRVLSQVGEGVVGEPE